MKVAKQDDQNELLNTATLSRRSRMFLAHHKRSLNNRITQKKGGGGAPEYGSEPSEIFDKVLSAAPALKARAHLTRG